MYVGIDVGNSDVKVVGGQGIKARFPSYARLAASMDLVSEDGPDGFTAKINDQDWLIGTVARQEGGSREYTKDKASREYFFPLLLSGIAKLANDVNIVPKIGIGLPINDYRKQATKIVAKIVGKHRVAMKGKLVIIEIKQENVIPFPEGAFAWDLALDWNGDQTGSVVTRNIASIDPGWKTVNFAVMQKMKYIDSMSGTLPNLGLSDAYRSFFKRAVREYDFMPNQIEERFFRDGWAERVELAKRVEDNLRIFWPDVREFDQIILAGGGGEAFRDNESLGIKGSYFSFPVTILSEAAFANARIFYKVARKKL